MMTAFCFKVVRFPACPSVQQAGSSLKPKRNVASHYRFTASCTSSNWKSRASCEKATKWSKKQFRSGCNEFSLHYPDMRLFVGLGEFRESEKVFDKSFGW